MQSFLEYGKKALTALALQTACQWVVHLPAEGCRLTQHMKTLKAHDRLLNP